jgi:hypothetical protein
MMKVEISYPIHKFILHHSASLIKPMRPRWRKIFLDLFDNWTRTLLVVFSIAVGVFRLA